MEDQSPRGRAVVEHLAKLVHAELAQEARDAIPIAMEKHRAVMLAGRALDGVERKHLVERLDEIERTLIDLVEEHMRAFGLHDLEPPASPAPAEPPLRVV